MASEFTKQLHKEMKERREAQIRSQQRSHELAWQQAKSNGATNYDRWRFSRPHGR